MELQLGAVLFEPGECPRQIYFPETSIVSLLYTLTDGESAEIAIIGKDGIVGLSTLLSRSGSTNRAVVQSAGTAVCVASNHLRREFDRGGSLHRILLHYIQASFARVGQVAVCNCHHTVEQQLCRWLLVSLDRLPSNTVRMTHELIANMIGVRRTSVTEVASRLRREGIIHYVRGCIEVLDRARLEACCCECYRVVASESERLLPHVRVAPAWYL